MPRSAEATRQRDGRPWWQWGPYLSERQWGTVREDYSANGDAWAYFPDDHARSRAYRWGEDGLGGFSDYRQRLCLGVVLWNEQDPILKERLFGLSNGEGNHGEDVKELYYYLDATPTHSYLRMLYKYPHAAFPYASLVSENSRRSPGEAEYELIDTGVFESDRYFDVQIEYAKADIDDILLRVSVCNRGPVPAAIHVLPQIWFRNTWSWDARSVKPRLWLDESAHVRVEHDSLGALLARFEECGKIYFCENETNFARLFGLPGGRYCKDAIGAAVVDRDPAAVNPEGVGTKCAAHYVFSLGAGARACVRMRLRRSGVAGDWFEGFDRMVDLRRRESDEFYAQLQSGIVDDDRRLIQRQAFAGLIWSKQYFGYDVRRWLAGDVAQPPPPTARRRGRNTGWETLHAEDVLSMPDKWEFPWFASWDLAFHSIPLALVDPEFAKRQLVTITREWYMHPNGQIPAYEWALSDANPPVHAWAAWRVYKIDRGRRRGSGDITFLERVFHKLLLNFTWWVNRKDADQNNVFQGGFLGLDNIGVLDRNAPLGGGGRLDQSDGTAWMAMYSLNMMRIALELARRNSAYEDIASKFFEHFLHIADAMTRVGDGLWDEADGFYYDWISLPDGSGKRPLRVRSIVGLIPLFAVEVLESDLLERLPGFARRLDWLLRERSDLHALVSRWEKCGCGGRRLLSLLRGHRMKALLRRMLDEREFLSEYGVRSLSRSHLSEPYRFDSGGDEFLVRYAPGDSDTRDFGGNSNWRGPIWLPINFLIIESLQRFHHYYGDEFRVECPTGSGQMMTLLEVAEDLTSRVVSLYHKSPGGRPAQRALGIFGDRDHFRDHILFFECFDGDTGRGVGASHQTGWTALIAKLIQPRRRTKSRT